MKKNWPSALPAITLFLVLIVPPVFKSLPEATRDPKGTLGITMGIISLVLILFAGFYSVRRARLWLQIGRLETWLSWHTYLGIITVLIVFLHADWKFRPGVATAALILLVLVTISGVVGWAIYFIIPGKISGAREEIITPEQVFYDMEKIQDQIDKLEKRMEKQKDAEATKTGEEIQGLQEKLVALEEKLEIEFRQEAALGSWLYMHVPLSAALIVVAGVHAFMKLYL